MTPLDLARSWLAGRTDGIDTRDLARAVVNLSELCDRQALHITHLVMQIRGKDWYEEVVQLRVALREACNLVDQRPVPEYATAQCWEDYGNRLDALRKLAGPQ